jgi:hypothetical protein
MKKYGGNLTKQEQDSLIEALPGQQSGDKPYLNTAKIYDQEYNNVLEKMYGKVDVTSTRGADDPTDEMGY